MPLLFSIRNKLTRKLFKRPLYRCLLARNWNKTSCQKKSSLQSSINNVLCILFHVICAMQIMSAIQPDTSTSALWNTRTQRLENISWKPMGTQASSKKANFAFSESAKEIWLPRLREAFYQRTQSKLEHTNWLHSYETIYLKQHSNTSFLLFLLSIYIFPNRFHFDLIMTLA